MKESPTIIPNTKNNLQIYHQIPRLLLLASGISGMLFFTTVDFIRPDGSPQFGTDQLAGFVTSSLMDLIANTAGTSIGLAFFLIEKKLAPYR